METHKVIVRKWLADDNKWPMILRECTIHQQTENAYLVSNVNTGGSVWIAKSLILNHVNVDLTPPDLTEIFG